jgi:hypothetical protein
MAGASLPNRKPQKQKIECSPVLQIRDRPQSQKVKGLLRCFVQNKLNVSTELFVPPRQQSGSEVIERL